MSKRLPAANARRTVEKGRLPDEAVDVQALREIVEVVNSPEDVPEEVKAKPERKKAKGRDKPDPD